MSLPRLRGFESMEVAVVSAVFLAFIAFAFVFLQQLSPASHYGQAQLNNIAQQKLDWVLLHRGDLYRGDLGLSAGYSYEPRIDEALLYPMAEVRGRTCTVTQKALADYWGSKVDQVGFGLVAVKGAAGVDKTAVLKTLFGDLRDPYGRPLWDQYDIELWVRPLVNITICPIGYRYRLAAECAAAAGLGQGVYAVAKGLYGPPVGHLVYTYIDAGTFGVSTGEAQLLTVSGNTAIYAVPIKPTDYSVVIVEKVDYPTAASFYVFNTTDRSLVYAGIFAGDLWIVHDHGLNCGGTSSSGTTPALGIRRVMIYTGAGFQTLVDEEVNLDPGVGVGGVKVDSCAACTGSARCAACYVYLPPTARFAVLEVEATGGKETRVVVVPGAPVPAVGHFYTWDRWTPNRPQIPTAYASRIARGMLNTYLVELLVYRK